MSESVGIMDAAYFVNKTDILRWINTALKLNVEKIDHLGNGAVYCQLLDIIYPGQINMSKVNWKAKLDYECLNNFKMVTTCLDKNDIKKQIDVIKLTKCKYQDNLEFAQWFKKFYETKGGDRTGDYDAEGRRNNVKNPTAAAVADVSKGVRKQNEAVQRASNASKITSSTGSTFKKPTPSKQGLNQQINLKDNNNNNHGQIKGNNNNNINSKRTSSQSLIQSNNGSSQSSASNKLNKSSIHNNFNNGKKTPSNISSLSPSSSSIHSNNNNDQHNNEYGLLISSIKDILSSNQDDSALVHQIRNLISLPSSSDANQSHDESPNSQDKDSSPQQQHQKHQQHDHSSELQQQSDAS